MLPRNVVLQQGELSLSSTTSSLLTGPHTVFRGGPRWWTLLLIIWCLGAAYAGVYLKRGWVPHDEGAFAQSADRVLHGELPHRDYTEIYTGGLAYLHALAFRYIGEDFATLRIVLFVFFFLLFPAFYCIPSRILSHCLSCSSTF